MGARKEAEPWDVTKWRSGNDRIDKAVYEVFCGLTDEKQEKACHRLIQIGEAAVPILVKALIDENTVYSGFAFCAGYCGKRNLPALKALEGIGSPLALPMLRQLHKYARKEKMKSSPVQAHRRLFSAIEDALYECDHRWWKKIFRSRR